MNTYKYVREDDEIIAKLRELPSLQPFHDEDLRGLLKMSKIERYTPNTLIIKEGQYDNHVYFLVSGRLGIQKNGETIAYLQRKGDIFGEMGIIDGSPRSASIRAIDASLCLVVDISYMDRLEGFDKIIFSGVLYRVLAEILAGRLRKADEELAKVKNEKAALQDHLRQLQARAAEHRAPKPR